MESGELHWFHVDCPLDSSSFNRVVNNIDRRST
jgi:hypothetical protein